MLRQSPPYPPWETALSLPPGPCGTWVCSLFCCSAVISTSLMLVAHGCPLKRVAWCHLSLGWGGVEQSNPTAVTRPSVRPRSC